MEFRLRQLLWEFWFFEFRHFAGQAFHKINQVGLFLIGQIQGLNVRA